MPVHARMRLLLLANASAVLSAAAPEAPLSYDPVVFLAGNCLSPALSGCGGPTAPAPVYASASQALLAADMEPRLRFELAGLIDMGPQVTGASRAPVMD